MTARFIALDGPAGAGKDEQSPLLQRAFAAAGLELVQVHEPQSTPDGEQLYAMLTKGEQGRWSGFAEACLWSAARNKANLDVVQPTLARGAWVLTNRTPLTTLGYQAYARGMDIDLCRAMQRAAAVRWPDFFVLLDVPSEVGLARKHAQKGQGNLHRFEKEGLAFQEKMRHGLLTEAPLLTEPYVVLDATPDIPTVHQAIIGAVNHQFGLTLQPVM
jgi:dTMP kinase